MPLATSCVLPARFLFVWQPTSEHGHRYRCSLGSQKHVKLVYVKLECRLFSKVFASRRLVRKQTTNPCMLIVTGRNADLLDRSDRLFWCSQRNVRRDKQCAISNGPYNSRPLKIWKFHTKGAKPGIENENKKKQTISNIGCTRSLCVRAYSSLCPVCSIPCEEGNFSKMDQWKHLSRYYEKKTRTPTVPYKKLHTHTHDDKGNRSNAIYTAT